MVKGNVITLRAQVSSPGLYDRCWCLCICYQYVWSFATVITIIFFFFSFRKESRYYTWIIKDAEIVLIDAEKKIQSPMFRVPGIESDLSLYASMSLAPTSRQSRGFTSMISVPTDMCQIGLNKAIKTEDAGYTVNDGVHVMALDCCFSLTNSWDGTTENMRINNRAKFIVNNKFFECFAKQTMEIQTFRKLLHENSLTINFSGKFMILSEPVESISQESQITDTAKQILKVMHEKNLFSDIQIEVGDKLFRVHRAVLASRSSVFHKMFEIDMKEKEEGRVKISDIEHDVMSDLLAYIYTGCVPQIKSHTKDLLLAADKYHIPDLVSLCEDELRSNLTPTNVAEVVLLADSLQLGSSKSKETCIYFIKENAEEVYKSESWKKLKESSLELAVEITEAVVLKT